MRLRRSAERSAYRHSESGRSVLEFCAVLAAVLAFAACSSEGRPAECDDYFDQSSEQPLQVVIQNDRESAVILREYGGCNDTPQLVLGRRSGQRVDFEFPRKCGDTCRELQSLDGRRPCTTDCANPGLLRLESGATRRETRTREFVLRRMPNACVSFQSNGSVGCYAAAPIDLRSLEITVQAMLSCDPDVIADCDAERPGLSTSMFEPLSQFRELSAPVETGTNEVVLRIR